MSTRAVARDSLPPASEQDRDIGLDEGELRARGPAAGAYARPSSRLWDVSSPVPWDLSADRGPGEDHLCPRASERYCSRGWRETRDANSRSESSGDRVPLLHGAVRVRDVRSGGGRCRGHRGRARCDRRELRLCRGTDPRRLRKLRRRSGADDARQQELPGQGRALRGPLDLWQAGLRRLLSRGRGRDAQVLDQVGVRSLHAAGRRECLLQHRDELLWCDRRRQGGCVRCEQHPAVRDDDHRAVAGSRPTGSASRLRMSLAEAKASAPGVVGARCEIG